MNERYSRQILFGGIGKEGQEKLLGSRVLLVGCGALVFFLNPAVTGSAALGASGEPLLDGRARRAVAIAEHFRPFEECVGLDHLLDDLATGCLEDSVLGLEVSVEGSQSDAGSGGYPGDRGLVIATLAELLRRGVQDLGQAAGVRACVLAQALQQRREPADQDQGEEDDDDPSEHEGAIQVSVP